MDKLPMHEYSDGYGTISSIYIEKESIQNLLDNFEKKWNEINRFMYDSKAEF